MFSPKYFARLSRDCRTNENENKLHSRESRETVSRGTFSKLDRNSRICGINVHSMTMQRKSCVCIVILCREIVANYSRTSLQLSHSSEVGAFSWYLTGMRISRDCFANFVADFRTTFVRVSHERRENFHVSQSSRELVAKVLNILNVFCMLYTASLKISIAIPSGRKVPIT